MKPRIKRYFISKSVGWGWGLFADPADEKPITHALDIRTLSIIYRMPWHLNK